MAGQTTESPEIVHDHYGIGELRLLLPAIARLSHQTGRWILIVSPPYIPYPPALVQAGVDLKRIIFSQPRNPKDYLWVLEKALASQSCSLVMAWPGSIHDKHLRRLQVASKDGNCWSVIFRPEQSAANASPAELRIRIRPDISEQQHSSLSLKILKRRGAWESEEIQIRFDDELQRPMPDFSDMVVEQASPSLDLSGHIPVPHRPEVYEYQ